MANTTTVPPTAAAVNEAARITAEASRRTAESAKASVEMARTYFDEAVDANRQFLGAMSASGEAALKASFEVQNASLSATLSLWETAAGANRGLLEQYAAALRQAQGASLEGWRTGVRAGEKLLLRSDERGR